MLNTNSRTDWNDRWNWEHGLLKRIGGRNAIGVQTKSILKIYFLGNLRQRLAKTWMTSVRTDWRVAVESGRNGLLLTKYKLHWTQIVFSLSLKNNERNITWRCLGTKVLFLKNYALIKLLIIKHSSYQVIGNKNYYDGNKNFWTFYCLCSTEKLVCNIQLIFCRSSWKLGKLLQFFNYQVKS